MDSKETPSDTPTGTTLTPMEVDASDHGTADPQDGRETQSEADGKLLGSSSRKPLKPAASRKTKPLEIGALLMCRWRDGQNHQVKIIERRKLPASKDYEYYVHYTEFDRRLDEWVKLEQLNLNYEEAGDDGKVEDKAASLIMTRKQKRKVEKNPHAGVSHAGGHEELDPASLREHEELTKVKNILKVELGRYEIDTWYFSPFPKEYSDCDKLFFCEFCLSFMKRKEQLQRHLGFHCSFLIILIALQVILMVIYGIFHICTSFSVMLIERSLAE